MSLSSSTGGSPEESTCVARLKVLGVLQQVRVIHKSRLVAAVLRAFLEESDELAMKTEGAVPTPQESLDKRGNSSAHALSGVAVAPPKSARKFSTYGLVSSAVWDRLSEPCTATDEEVIDALLGWWGQRTRGRQEKAWHCILKLKPSLNLAVGEHIYPKAALLLSAAGDAFQQFGSCFYPHDELGWVVGVQGVGDSLCAHVLLFPTTGSGLNLNLSQLAPAIANGVAMRVDFRGALHAHFERSLRRRLSGLAEATTPKSVLNSMVGQNGLLYRAAFRRAGENGTLKRIVEVRNNLSMGLGFAAVLAGEQEALRSEVENASFVAEDFAENRKRLGIARRKMEKIRVECGASAQQLVEDARKTTSGVAEFLKTRRGRMPGQGADGAAVNTEQLLARLELDNNAFVLGIQQRIAAFRTGLQDCRLVHEFLTDTSLDVRKATNKLLGCPLAELSPEARIPGALMSRDQAIKSILDQFIATAQRLAREHQAFDPATMANRKLAPYARQIQSTELVEHSVSMVAAPGEVTPVVLPDSDTASVNSLSLTPTEISPPSPESYRSILHYLYEIPEKFGPAANGDTRV